MTDRSSVLRIFAVSGLLDRIISANDRLYPAKYELPVFSAEREAEESSGSESEAELAERLRKDNPSLTLFKLKDFASPFFMFAEGDDRLLIMSSEETERVLMRTGAAAQSSFISSLFFRKDRERLIAETGEDLFDFAVNFGRFALKQLTVRPETEMSFRSLFMLSGAAFFLHIPFVFSQESFAEVFKQRIRDHISDLTDSAEESESKSLFAGMQNEVQSLFSEIKDPQERQKRVSLLRSQLMRMVDMELNDGKAVPSF